MVAFSIPYTCLAPALAEKILNTPVPHPISNTIFPSNKCGFFKMASL